MRDQKNPSTAAELMEQAAAALASRDPQRLEELERISDGWLQPEWERRGQRMMLQAMAEAAEMLLDQPSDLGWDDDADDDAEGDDSKDPANWSPEKAEDQRDFLESLRGKVDRAEWRVIQMEIDRIDEAHPDLA